MPFRITEDDPRAVKALHSGSVDGARAVSGEITASSSVGTFVPLERAYETYQQIKADAGDHGVHEQPDEAYMAATFAGMQEAVTRKCGEMPIGCWRCEGITSRPYPCAVWIRHDGERHYLVFTDASGNSTEYRIYFCPWCGKRF